MKSLVQTNDLSSHASWHAAHLRVSVLHYVRVATSTFILVVSLPPYSNAENDAVANMNAEQIWNRVLAKNHIWLLPKAENRSYVAISTVLNDESGREKFDRVWISSGNARWEMGTRNVGNEKSGASVVLVIRGEKEEYLTGGRPSHRRGQVSSGITRFVQGIAWQSSMHVLAQIGLPKNTRVVNQRVVRGGRIVVLEANLGKNGGSHMGLGLNHEFLHYGHSATRFKTVRIHVKTPEFIPIREEYAESDTKIELVGEFFAVGEQRAPKLARYVAKAPDGSNWVIEARFQMIGRNWLLKNAKNNLAGETLSELVIKEFSQESNPDRLFKFSKPN